MPTTIHDLVPMIHVIDVDRSIAFYELLGFAAANRMAHASDSAFWAWLNAGAARLMLTRADPAIDPNTQGTILYLYAQDLPALRAHLLSSGLTDGGAFPSKEHGTSEPRRIPDRNAVFEITRPFYMPKGELRVHDPDGYCLLIGDTAGRTP